MGGRNKHRRNERGKEVARDIKGGPSSRSPEDATKLAERGRADVRKTLQTLKIQLADTEFIFSSDVSKNLASLTAIQAFVECGDEIDINFEIEGKLREVSNYLKPLNNEAINRNLNVIWQRYDHYRAPRPKHFNEERTVFLKAYGPELKTLRKQLADMAEGGSGEGRRSHFEKTGWKDRDFKKLLEFDARLTELQEMSRGNKAAYLDALKSIHNLVSVLESGTAEVDSDTFEAYEKFYPGWKLDDFKQLLLALSLPRDQSEDPRSPEQLAKATEMRERYIAELPDDLDELEKLKIKIQEEAAKDNYEDIFEHWMPQDFEMVLEASDQKILSLRLAKTFDYLGSLAGDEAELIQRQIGKLFKMMHAKPIPKEIKAPIQRLKDYATQVLFKVVPGVLLDKKIDRSKIKGGQKVYALIVTQVEEIDFFQQAGAIERMKQIFKGDEEKLICEALNEFARLTGETEFLETVTAETPEIKLFRQLREILKGETEYLAILDTTMNNLGKTPDQNTASTQSRVRDRLAQIMRISDSNIRKNELMAFLQSNDPTQPTDVELLNHLSK